VQMMPLGPSTLQTALEETFSEVRIAPVQKPGPSLEDIRFEPVHNTWRRRAA
jgi:hypothetical protein